MIGISSDHSWEVLPCRYVSASSFKLENAWVGVAESDGTYAYFLIDRNGREIFSGRVYDLDDSGKFGQSSCAIRDANGRLRYGIMDNKGLTVLPFIYDQVTMYSERDPATGQSVQWIVTLEQGKTSSFPLCVE